VTLIYLSTFWLIVVNAAAWAAIQIGVGYFAAKISGGNFNPEGAIFKERHWEQGGKIYEKLFRVSRWKSWLPSGGKFFGIFSINHFRSSARDYAQKWLVESCRAEFIHWVAMLPALLFFLWNPFNAWMINIGYAICANVPCIISQRHNRPRVMRFLRRYSRQAAVVAETRKFL